MDFTRVQLAFSSFSEWLILGEKAKFDGKKDGGRVMNKCFGGTLNKSMHEEVAAEKRK